MRWFSPVAGFCAAGFCAVGCADGTTDTGGSGSAAVSADFVPSPVSGPAPLQGSRSGSSESIGFDSAHAGSDSSRDTSSEWSRWLRFPAASAQAGTSGAVDGGCPNAKFCEDFEAPAWREHWTGAFVAGGDLGLAVPWAGAHALRVVTSGRDAASYLTRDLGKIARGWVSGLAFSGRLVAPPTNVVGGPELVVLDAIGGATRIGFSFGSKGIFLHQIAASCHSDACVRSARVADSKEGEWRRLDVAVEAADGAGRVEVVVDRGALFTLPLEVSSPDGSLVAHVGITSADWSPSELNVDDVVIFRR